MRKIFALAFWLALVFAPILNAQTLDIERDVLRKGEAIYTIEDITHKWTNPYGHCTYLTLKKDGSYLLEPFGEESRSGKIRIDHNGTMRFEDAGSKNLLLLRRKDFVSLCGFTRLRRFFVTLHLDICFYSDRSC